VNASFYRLPSESAIDAWLTATPRSFRFVLKGSRLITHARRLESGQALQTFLGRAGRFGSRLAAILWQLPPGQERDDERLLRFVEQLPETVLQAVEFRHSSWCAPEVDGLLARCGAARVAVSTPAHGIETLPGSGPVYVRFHGLSGGYAHDYTESELRPWVKALRTSGGRTGFAFFNNDGEARAPSDAVQLRSLLA
jgi:uncharacterized protein YecE (DUF72 family)